MKQEIIDKLPPDAQKEFLRLAMKLEEKTKQDLLQQAVNNNSKSESPKRGKKP